MAETRRRTSSKQKQQYWQSHSKAYQESGLTRAAYCKQNKLNLKTFAYWRHRLKYDAAPVKLVQLPSPTPQSFVALRLAVNGYGIEVCEGFSPSALAELVCVLREL